MSAAGASLAIKSMLPAESSSGGPVHLPADPKQCRRTARPAEDNYPIDGRRSHRGTGRRRSSCEIAGGRRSSSSPTDRTTGSSCGNRLSRVAQNKPTIRLTCGSAAWREAHLKMSGAHGTVAYPTSAIPVPSVRHERDHIPLRPMSRFALRPAVICPKRARGRTPRAMR